MIKTLLCKFLGHSVEMRFPIVNTNKCKRCGKLLKTQEYTEYSEEELLSYIKYNLPHTWKALETSALHREDYEFLHKMKNI